MSFYEPLYTKHNYAQKSHQITPTHGNHHESWTLNYALINKTIAAERRRKSADILAFSNPAHLPKINLFNLRQNNHYAPVRKPASARRKQLQNLTNCFLTETCSIVSILSKSIKAQMSLSWDQINIKRLRSELLNKWFHNQNIRLQEHAYAYKYRPP